MTRTMITRKRVAIASLVFPSPFAVVAAHVRVDQLRRRRRRRTAERGLCTHAMASVNPVVGTRMSDLKSPVVEESATKNLTSPVVGRLISDLRYPVAETIATKNLFNLAADMLLSDLKYPVVEAIGKDRISPVEVMVGVTMIAEEMLAPMQLGTSYIVILSSPEQLRMSL